jgi:hypothetical protein
LTVPTQRQCLRGRRRRHAPGTRRSAALDWRSSWSRPRVPSVPRHLICV